MTVSFTTSTSISGNDETISIIAGAGSDIEAYNFSISYDTGVATYIQQSSSGPSKWTVTDSIDQNPSGAVVVSGTGVVGGYDATSGSKPIAASSAGLLATLDFTLNDPNVPVDGSIVFTSYQVGSSAPVNGASLYTLTFACFVAGTAIATAKGPVAVEDLRAGDHVVTAAGATRPILWMGHRRLHSDDTTQQPIHIRAHSFGANLPARSLYVSPEHAVFIDGVLIPAMHLVNGHSITQEALGEITYFHVLLDRHDVILAEGLPAETLLFNDNADSFDNAATAAGLPLFMSPCAPRVTKGERLEAIRERLRAFA